MRTNKGPQRSWLHRIGKAESKNTHADRTQDGEHITFHCPLHGRPRINLIGARADDSWEAPDKALLIKDREGGREQYVDGMELFFEYIFAQLT